MDLWSVRLLIEDKYKNIFSEYIEDMPGYVSSSLYVDEKLDKDIYPIIFSKNVTNNKVGEFYQANYWVLEFLVNQKPKTNNIIKKINFLAKELKIDEYYTNDPHKKKTFANRMIVSKVVKKNWIKYNRKSFPPIHIDNFYIYGNHINKNCAANKLQIKIDASTAFGTGSHETTKCCLKSLTFVSRFLKPNKILDYGCGTGILGIASKRIFKKNKITFVDIDKKAIKLTKENLKLNNVISNKVYLSNSYNSNKYKKKKYYDLIFANILYGSLYELAPFFSSFLKPNSYLILSGLLKEQVPYTINRYNKFGLKVKKKFLLNEWGSVIMKLN